MRLQPIELTEDSTLEDIAKEVYQCWIQNDSTRQAYAQGVTNYAELHGTETDLNKAMDKLRIKLYKP